MSGLDGPPRRMDRELESTDARDGEAAECEALERRWRLWHGFMEEHAHLDAWLRSAERALASGDTARVTRGGAVDDVRRFQRLRCEVASRLSQLDALSQKKRSLAPLFQGAMRARLLAAVRDCRLRWKSLNVKLESLGEKVQGFQYEWEEFKEETEELAVWLAEMEAGLTQVLHATGNTCQKLRQLQRFKQSVSVNSARVNGVLQRGEVLIQHADDARDAERVERRLLELLRQCAHIYGDIGRARTRLLSMRLVFEDDFLLSPPPPDSGCPSETWLDEDRELWLDPTERRRHSQPSRPPSPSNEPLGLEWDPSVDIGRHLSFCAVNTGVAESDERRSYLASLDSEDIAESRVDRRAESDIRGRGPAFASRNQATQTDAQCSGAGDPPRLAAHVPSCRGDERADSSKKPRRTQEDLKREDKKESYNKARQRRYSAVVGKAAVASGAGAGSAKCLLLVAALSVLVCLLWSFPEPPCHHTGAVNLHLSYVNGPPPT
ncbi:nesprin-2 [Stigmatopora nigra]